MPPPVQLGTVRSTAVPGVTTVPGAGLCVDTEPGSTHVFGCSTVPTVRPAATIAARALLSQSPSTSGTVALPRDTMTYTIEPAGSTVPPGESWEMTVPAGAGLLTVLATDAVKPCAR